jgi:AcrR family transcriptional regulator
VADDALPAFRPVSARRDAILDAALHCFANDGYERTTIEDIRVRSGASTGSIYHHFGGKEEIAAALYAEALASYHEGFLRLLAAGSAERTIKAMVRHHLRWVDENPERAGFLLAPRAAELRLAGEFAVRKLNRAAFAALEDWRRAHAGELRPVSFDAFYAIVIGPAHEAARHRLAGRTQIPLRRLERELADAAWRAIRGGSE